MSLPVEKKIWYSGGLCFGCERCGDCCGGAPGYVWVNREEIEKIARRLDMSVEQFRQRHVRRVGSRYSLLELENGDCEFLIRGGDGLTGCAVHDVRPLQCRTWPFWESNLASRRAWAATGRRCPGIDQGEHYPPAIIQDCLRRAEEADLPL